MIDTRLSFVLWLLFDLLFLSAIVARAGVRYRTWNETATDYDREVIERDELPKERRRGLR